MKCTRHGPKSVKRGQPLCNYPFDFTSAGDIFIGQNKGFAMAQIRNLIPWAMVCKWALTAGYVFPIHVGCVVFI